MNRERYYAAHLGRWVNRDPIGYWAGDANLYGYVASNPTYYHDPFGLIVNPVGDPLQNPWYPNGLPGMPIKPKPPSYPNATVGGGVSVGGFVPIPYLPFLPSPVSVQVGGGAYINPSTGEYDCGFSCETGIGLGFGGSCDLTLYFSPNASPEDMSSGPYSYTELNTPFGDFGYQGLPYGGDVYYGGVGAGFEIGIQAGGGSSGKGPY